MESSSHFLENLYFHTLLKCMSKLSATWKTLFLAKKNSCKIETAMLVILLYYIDDVSLIYIFKSAIFVSVKIQKFKIFIWINIWIYFFENETFQQCPIQWKSFSRWLKNPSSCTTLLSSKSVGVDRLCHILIVHPYIKYIVYGLCFMWPRSPK